MHISPMTVDTEKRSISIPKFPRKRTRIATAGQYGGVSANYLAKVVGLSKRHIKKELEEFYGLEQWSGREHDPQVLGYFIEQCVAKKRATTIEKYL